MEQRDYLLRQIELMTQAFVSLIRRLLGLKELKEEEIEQTTDEVFTKQLDLSLSQVMEINLDEIVDFIISKKGIDLSNVDLLARILVINAYVREDAEQKADLYKKALELYEWSDKKSHTYSMERFRKMEEIRYLLAKGFKNK